MADSPNLNAKDLVSFNILSNGSPIKDTVQVMEISVDYNLNVIPTAVIKMIDGDVAEKDFEVANSNSFVPGAEVEIQAGYEGENETIFKGIVVSMKISLDASQGSVLEITCSDKSILMTENHKNTYFTEVKDSDVISSLIGNYSGLTADTDSTTYSYDELVQYNATDWDFMMIRADINGLVVSVNAGKVSVKKPAVTSSAVLSLTYGVDLIEFEADLNSIDQLPEVEASSWDVATQKVVKGTSSEPTTAAIGNITGKKISDDLGIKNEQLFSSGQLNEEILKAWADAKLIKSRLACLTGTATFVGSALVVPNSIVELKGVGDRFSGNAFVSAVKHLIQDGKWTTEICFGLEDEWFAAKPNVNSLPASGLTPKVGGLMIGKVKKLDADPNGEQRIQVTLPMMADDGNGIWARLSTFYATNGKGNFFIPEIDDEVVIGFLNDDPNFPIILGSLYSSTLPPPYELTADNNTKAIVTKSDCKIEFDDDKKIITIQTPGENKIIFSDDEKSITITDQNANTITTDSDGIKLKDSNSNEIIMTSGGVEIKSSSNIKLTAQGDVTVSGLNITNDAQVAMKSSGQASAEFSASGQTTVKGAMVMIN